MPVPTASSPPPARAVDTIARASVGVGASSPSTSALSIASNDAAFSNYQRLLNERIAQHSRYPAEARSLRLAGVTYLAFRIGRDGGVLESWIQESSGSEMLDSAALAALGRAAPMPPIPAALSSPLEFVVEIDSLATFAPDKSRPGGG